MGVLEQLVEVVRLDEKQRSENWGWVLEAQVASVKSWKRKWQVKEALKWSQRASHGVPGPFWELLAVGSKRHWATYKEVIIKKGIVIKKVDKYTVEQKTSLGGC